MWTEGPRALIIVALEIGACSNGGDVQQDAAPGSLEDALTAGDGLTAEAAPDSGHDASAWAPASKPCGIPGRFKECPIPGWKDRPYTIFLPEGHDLTRPTAVVLMFHGGSGSSQSAIKTTCPGGDTSDAACLHQVAQQKGFAVVYPNGSWPSLPAIGMNWVNCPPFHS